MLSLDTATKLKQAGLAWQPTLHDAFFIPFQDLDERVFVISDMSVLIEQLGDEQAITFNGTAEWALDYLVLTDAVWVPSESQLRDLIEKQLMQRGETQPLVILSTASDGYVCDIAFDGQRLPFEEFGASEAYGKALLYILRQSATP